MSSPVFVALGTILAIPGNVVVDAIVDRRGFSVAFLLGAVLIVAAFLCIATEPQPEAAHRDDGAGDTLVDDAPDGDRREHDAPNLLIDRGGDGAYAPVDGLT